MSTDTSPVRPITSTGTTGTSTAPTAGPTPPLTTCSAHPSPGDNCSAVAAPPPPLAHTHKLQTDDVTLAPLFPTLSNRKGQ